MSFFDSDIVKAEMADIHQLQEEIYSSVMNFPYMSAADKTEPVSYTHLTLPTTVDV